MCLHPHNTSIVTAIMVAGRILNAYGNTTDLNWMAGSQYVYSFGKCIFMPSDLTAGIEFNQDKLEDNMWGYHRTVDQK